MVVSPSPGWKVVDRDLLDLLKLWNLSKYNKLHCSVLLSELGSSLPLTFFCSELSCSFFSHFYQLWSSFWSTAPYITGGWNFFIVNCQCIQFLFLYLLVHHFLKNQDGWTSGLFLGSDFFFLTLGPYCGNTSISTVHFSNYLEGEILYSPELKVLRRTKNFPYQWACVMLSCVVFWSGLYSDTTTATSIVINRVMWDLTVQLVSCVVSQILFHMNAVYAFKEFSVLNWLDFILEWLINISCISTSEYDFIWIRKTFKMA